MTFGDLYAGIDRLKGYATELHAAYENDVSVYALSERAASIRVLASQLEDVLNQMGTALQNLEV